MLAPRQKLWSTPMAVVENALQLLDVRDDDVVLDLGSGDGRFLLECAKLSGAHCVGVEIEEARVERARRRVEEEQLSDRIDLRVLNILDLTPEDVAPTAIFAYLCPRGYRKILPLLEKLAQSCEKPPLRVVTYMAGLPDTLPVLKVLVTPKHQPSAQWPLFLYHLQHEDAEKTCDLDGAVEDAT